MLWMSLPFPTLKRCPHHWSLLLRKYVTRSKGAPPSPCLDIKFSLIDRPVNCAKQEALKPLILLIPASSKHQPSCPCFVSSMCIATTQLSIDALLCIVTLVSIVSVL